MSEVFSDIQVNFQQARRQIQEMHRALSTTRESNAVLIDGSLEAIKESRKLLRDAQDQAPSVEVEPELPRKRVSA